MAKINTKETIAAKWISRVKAKTIRKIDPLTSMEIIIGRMAL